MPRSWRYILPLVLVLTAWSAPPLALAGTALEGPGHSDWHGYSWFTFNGFPVPAGEFPVRLVLLGEPPTGMSLEQIERGATAVAKTWSAVSCTSAPVVYAGHRQTLEDLAPGELPFLFTSPQRDPCFLDGRIAYTPYSCSQAFPKKTVFLNARDYDWADKPRPFQPTYTDPASDERATVDLESVLTHEVGHVLGLSHTDDPLATMYPSYRGDGSQASLAVDDKLGLCTLYGFSSSPDECSSGRDCAVDEACERIDGMDLCRERRGEPGDACALDRLICEEACVLPRSQDRFGYCTIACEVDGSGCPDGFRCVEGLLGAGQSHCEQVAGLEEPTCSATGRRAGWPPTLWWVWLLGSIVGVRLICWSRCSTSSSRCSR